MNILDALILIILTTVFLYYCHKKKKLFFREKDHGGVQKGDPPKGETPAIPAPPAVPYPPYPYWDMRGMHAVPPSVRDDHSGGITLCRLIPWTFGYNPLPFADAGEKCTTADDAVNADIIPLGVTLDNEIRSLNGDGYEVCGISVVSLPLGDGAVRTLFCITCAGGRQL